MKTLILVSISLIVMSANATTSGGQNCQHQVQRNERNDNVCSGPYNNLLRGSGIKRNINNIEQACKKSKDNYLRSRVAF